MEITVGMKVYKTGQKLPGGGACAIEYEVTKVTKTSFTASNEKRYTINRYSSQTNWEEWGSKWSRHFNGVRSAPLDGEQIVTPEAFTEALRQANEQRKAAEEAKLQELLSGGARRAVALTIKEHKGGMWLASELSKIRKTIAPDLDEELQPELCDYIQQIEMGLADAYTQLKYAAEHFDRIAGDAQRWAEEARR